MRMKTKSGLHLLSAFIRVHLWPFTFILLLQLGPHLLQQGERRLDALGLADLAPDTPVQCYALAASHFNESLVEGHEVRLDFDAERRDVYGRLLAYVHVGDTFVNAELVRRGYARTLTIPPNDSYADRFDRLARAAAADGRGLWGSC